MNPNNGVYDDKDKKPVTKPGLQNLEEGKQPSDSNGVGGLFNPDGDKKDNRVLDGKSLNNAEGSGLPGEKLGKGYNASSALAIGGLGGKLAGVFKTKKGRRRALIAGGSGGSVVAAVVVIFLSLIPLKIESIVDNLENHFFGTANSAVSNETDELFQDYIEKDVGSALTKKSCGTTISSHCTVNVFGNGNNPVTNLYKTWSQANLEGKLAKDYGIEFSYDSATKTYYMKAPGITRKDGEEPISKPDEGHIDDSMFKEVDQGTIRDTVSDALSNETGWKNVLYRYKIGRFLEEKYGVKRCLIFCGSIDSVQNFARKKVNTAQVLIAQRVIVPRTETLGIVLQCLLDSGCDPEKTTETPPETGTTGELNGAPENATVDGKVRTNLEQLAGTYGITDAATINSMIAEYKDIADNGYQKYILNKAFTAVGIDGVGDNIADSAPVIGWIKAASSVITNLSKIGPNVKKLSYITNATAAVSLFTMYQTYADEIHTGNVNASDVGSMTDSLGPGNHGEPSDPEVGGTASAESTPLYSYLMNGDSPASPSSSGAVSLLDSILPSKAYADTTSSTSSGSSDYKCSNGPIPAGKLVCPEEVLGQGSSTLSSISNFFKEPGVNILTAAAKVVNNGTNIIGSLIGDLFSALSSIPGIHQGVNAVSGLVSSAFKPAFTSLISDVIPDPFGTNMSGGRIFDMMAAGADVSGNDYAHNGLGGRELTTQQVATITTQQETTAQQQFSHESLFARVFSTNNTLSLVSKVSMDMPISLQSSAETGFASLVSNPFNILTHSFSSLFSGKASAAEAAQNDPFGVTQYGYTSSDLAAIGDPQTYWDQHCSDGVDGAQTQAWDTDAANYNINNPSDPDPSGMPVNTTTDPCLLIEASVGSAGGIYNSSLLTPDDLADVNSSSSSGSSGTTTAPPTTGTTAPSGNAEQVAQQILSNKNIDLSCLSSSVEQDVQDAAKGQPGTAGAMTSVGILQIIEAVGQSHKVCVTAIQSDGQGHCNGEPKSECPDDPHYTGNAVDFGSLDGVEINGRNAPALTIMKIAQAVVSIGAFGQSQCGATPPLASGWSDFEDTCNHLHVQDISPDGSS